MNHDHELIPQSQKISVNAGLVQAIAYLDNMISITDLDSLLTRLYEDCPDREDYTCIAIRIFMEDILAAAGKREVRPGKNKQQVLDQVHKDFGRLVVHRLVTLYGLNRVYTRRDESGNAKRQKISPPLVSSDGADKWYSYAAHRIMLNGQNANARKNEAPKTNFLTFLSSCPALGEIDVSRNTHVNPERELQL